MLDKLHYQLAFPCWFSTVKHHRGAVYSWSMRSRCSTKTKTMFLKWSLYVPLYQKSPFTIMIFCFCVFFNTIDQFRDIKFQPKTIDPSTRLWGITTEFVGFIPLEPRAAVNCFRLNFNISKLVYCVGKCAKT